MEKRMLNEVLTRVSRKGKVIYPINETETLKGTSIDVLNLDTRCSNGLKRNKIYTIGELLTSIENGTLIQIHSLGRKSVSRIMYELCAYQYTNLSNEGKDRFLKRIIELNKEEVCVNA